MTGLIVNETDKMMQMIYIAFNTYDTDGIKNGSAMALVTDLGPGEKAKFEAFSGYKFDSFKYVSTTVHF